MLFLFHRYHAAGCISNMVWLHSMVCEQLVNTAAVDPSILHPYASQRNGACFAQHFGHAYHWSRAWA
jgi:hypothetical protein